MDEPVIPMVHAFIDSRDAAGMVTYGKPLTTFDGRNSIRDAQEEAGDLLNYLTELVAEWPVIADLLDRAACAIEVGIERPEMFPICMGIREQLRDTAARMRGDIGRVEPTSAADRTPAERLAEMPPGGGR